MNGGNNVQILISGMRIFDGHDMIEAPRAVLIEDGHIAAIDVPASFEGFAGTVLDAAGDDLTLMPGMIDCHVHLTLGAEADPGTAQGKLSDAALALKALERAQKTLKAGIVAIRDCGGHNYVDIDVRDALNAGTFQGADMRACGRMICMTGGHGNRSGIIADGCDEVIRAVRANIHKRADVIKLMATGGVMTPGVNPEDAHYTEAELAAGVAEAERFHRTTASHAQGAEGILNAVRAGVTSIEHGIFMNDECLREMLERDTFLVPTLSAVANILKNRDNGIPAFIIEKSERVYERHIGAFTMFYQAGGRIAMGTDAGTPFNQHGENPQELALMVEAGMRPLDALTAATSTAADLLRLEDHGRIEAGAIADLLIVEGNPAEDIAAAADPANHRLLLRRGQPAGASARPVIAL